MTEYITPVPLSEWQKTQAEREELKQQIAALQADLSIEEKIEIGRAAMSAFFESHSPNLNGQLEALISSCINLTIAARAAIAKATEEQL